MGYKLSNDGYLNCLPSQNKGIEYKVSYKQSKMEK